MIPMRIFPLMGSMKNKENTQLLNSKSLPYSAVIKPFIFIVSTLGGSFDYLLLCLIMNDRYQESCFRH